MASMSTKLTSWFVRAAMAAGAAGAILGLAGVDSPVRAALVLIFVAVTPTAAIAGLLGGFEGFARRFRDVLTHAHFRQSCPRSGAAEKHLFSVRQLDYHSR